MSEQWWGVRWTLLLLSGSDHDCTVTLTIEKEPSLESNYIFYTANMLIVVNGYDC